MECWINDCAFDRVDSTYCERHLGQVYVYAWGNNERRADLKGRRCVIEASGAMGTCLVRFLDTDERVTTSRRALRKETS